MNHSYRDEKMSFKKISRYPLHNFQVRFIHNTALIEALERYSNGILLDVGCGDKPYRNLTQSLNSMHIGIDHPVSLHNKVNVGIFCTSYDISLASHSIDTILCAAVLEHLEKPSKALNEIFRILKPGGCLIKSAPLFWHIHEEPRDFYRYTKFGLQFLLNQSGFDFIEIKPLSGFWITFGTELAYYLQKFKRGLFRYVISFFVFIITFLQPHLDRGVFLDENFTWMYLVTAKKPYSLVSND